jgi:hypothetical protein
MNNDTKKSINNIKVSPDVFKKVKFLSVDMESSMPDVVANILEKVVDGFFERTYTKNLKIKNKNQEAVLE